MAAAAALPMQIFIGQAADSIVTVSPALQWLDVQPC